MGIQSVDAIFNNGNPRWVPPFVPPLEATCSVEIGKATVIRTDPGAVTPTNPQGIVIEDVTNSLTITNNEILVNTPITLERGATFGGLFIDLTVGNMLVPARAAVKLEFLDGFERTPGFTSPNDAFAQAWAGISLVQAPAGFAAGEAFEEVLRAALLGEQGDINFATQFSLTTYYQHGYVAQLLPAQRDLNSLPDVTVTGFAYDEMTVLLDGSTLNSGLDIDGNLINLTDPSIAGAQDSAVGWTPAIYITLPSTTQSTATELAAGSRLRVSMDVTNVPSLPGGEVQPTAWTDLACNTPADLGDLDFTFSDFFQDPDPLKNGGGFYTIRPPMGEAPTAFDVQGGSEADVDGETVGYLRNLAAPNALGGPLDVVAPANSLVIHDNGVLAGKLGLGDGTPDGELTAFYPIDNSGQIVIPPGETSIEQALFSARPFANMIENQILEATTLVFGKFLQGEDDGNGNITFTGTGLPIVFGQAYKIEQTGVDGGSGENLYRVTTRQLTGGPPQDTVQENVLESAVDFAPIDILDDGQQPPVVTFQQNEEFQSLFGFPYWFSVRQLTVTRFLDGDDLTAAITRITADPPA